MCLLLWVGGSKAWIRLDWCLDGASTYTCAHTHTINTTTYYINNVTGRVCVTEDLSDQGLNRHARRTFGSVCLGINGFAVLRIACFFHTWVISHFKGCSAVSNVTIYTCTHICVRACPRTHTHTLPGVFHMKHARLWLCNTVKKHTWITHMNTYAHVIVFSHLT